MKDLIKRIILSLLFIIIISIFFLSIAKCSIKENNKYRYLTYENEWGESSKCYFEDHQMLICEVNDSLLRVRQYYDN